MIGNKMVSLKNGLLTDTQEYDISTSYVGNYGRIGNFDDYSVQLDPADGSIWSIQKRPTPIRRNTRRQHNYWFIGDIHSNIASYIETIKSIRNEDPDAITIQVGDLDLGQVKLPRLGEKDFFIQGNHDDLGACEKHPNFLGKFGFKHNVFFLGGAETGGMGYANEELTTKELEQAIELYEEVMPEIVVTHDCPQDVKEIMFYKKEKTRTGIALQKMFNIFNPLVWAFGHHHSGQREYYDGTDFICCSPLAANQVKLAWSVGAIERGKEIVPVEMTVKKAISRMFGQLLPSRS